MADTYTVLKGGLLIDGNGGNPVEDSVLVIKNDRIDAVGKADEVGAYPQDVEILDGNYVVRTQFPSPNLRIHLSHCDIHL